VGGMVFGQIRYCGLDQVFILEALDYVGSIHELGTGV